MSKSLKIKDFPDYYVTDSGQIYSRFDSNLGRIRLIKKVKDKGGYERVCLHNEGKQYNRQVHRLVAQEFIPNKYNKPQVNHKNGNRSDNRVSNLEWVSASENIQHSFKQLSKKANTPWLGKFGKDNSSAKMVQQIKDGEIVAEFYGTYEASRKTGINKQVIGDCCRGRQKTAGGYQWKYIV